MTKLSLDEMETIINYSRTEKEAHVYTSDFIVMRQLDKLCEEQPEIFRIDSINKYKDSDEICSKTYIIADKKHVKITKKRVLSDEEKEKLSIRGKKLTEYRLKGKENAS